MSWGTILDGVRRRWRSGGWGEYGRWWAGESLGCALYCGLFWGGDNGEFDGGGTEKPASALCKEPNRNDNPTRWLLHGGEPDRGSQKWGWIIGQRKRGYAWSLSGC